MNLFDIGIIAIIGIAMLVGFAKGFLKSFSSLLGWLLSITLAILFAKAVANLLCDIPFISKYFFNNPDGFSFAGWIYKILPESLKIEMPVVREWITLDGVVVEGASDILITNIKDRHSIIGIFVSIFEKSYITTLTSPSVLFSDFNDLAHALSVLIANSILVFIVGILLLIIFRIISNILIKIAKSTAKSSRRDKEGKSFFGRLIGLIFGGAKGALICAILLSITSLMINFPFLSIAKKELTEKDSIIAAKFSEMVFDATEKLLGTDDIDKLLKASGITVPTQNPQSISFAQVY